MEGGSLYNAYRYIRLNDHMDPFKSLAQRVNEVLGKELVRRRLAHEQMIEEAMPIFNDFIAKDAIKRASILKIISWDLDLIEEKSVLDYQIDHCNLGYCNLVNYQIDRDNLPHFTLEECWGTMTLPFDFMAGVFFVATSSYLSPDALEHWGKRLSREIVWFVSDLSTLTLTLEEMEKEEERQLEAAHAEDGGESSSADVEA